MKTTKLPSYSYFTLAGPVVATFASAVLTVFLYSTEKVAVALAAVWISAVTEGAVAAFFAFVSYLAGAPSLDLVAL